MKTIGIDDELFEQAMARARAMGMTFEDFIDDALATQIERTAPVGTRPPLRLVKTERIRLFDDAEVALLLGTR